MTGASTGADNAAGVGCEDYLFIPVGFDPATPATKNDRICGGTFTALGSGAIPATVCSKYISRKLHLAVEKLRMSQQ